MTMPPAKTLQVSCVQLHWAKPLERNLERTLHYIRLAASEGSRVVLFPEANLTGYYFPDVLKLAPEAALPQGLCCDAAWRLRLRRSGALAVMARKQLMPGLRTYRRYC